jgi:hypothetical protein
MLCVCVNSVMCVLCKVPDGANVMSYSCNISYACCVINYIRDNKFSCSSHVVATCTQPSIIGKGVLLYKRWAMEHTCLHRVRVGYNTPQYIDFANLAVTKRKPHSDA